MKRVARIIFLTPPGLLWILIMVVLPGFIGNTSPSLILKISILWWIGFGIGTIQNYYVIGYQELLSLSFGKTIKLVVKSVVYGPFTYLLFKSNR